MTPQQLPFTLPARTSYDPAAFLEAACNRNALTWLRQTNQWHAIATCLYGPPQCGKTHLVHVWSRRVGGAYGFDSATLPDINTEDIARDFPYVAIDDASKVAGHPRRERALFHLYNSLKTVDGRLLLADVDPPSRWGVGLPDLLSRLNTAYTIRLDEPDDALLAAVLNKLFADRQLSVKREVIAYIVPRMTRTFAAAQAVVDGMDRAMLASKTAPTKAIARDVLRAVEALGWDEAP